MTERTLETLSRGRLALRRVAVGARQVARLARWHLDPARYPRPGLTTTLPHRVWTGRQRVVRPSSEPVLEEGKRRNLALAAPAFDGLEVTPARPLSFWRALGRITEARGYVMGRELRGGCVVPALGGGICLLSNALFEAAARLGWSVLERSGHSLEAVPPTPDAIWGLDATVLWPHVDLRLAPARGAARLGVCLDGDDLVLTVDATEPVPDVRLWTAGDRTDDRDGVSVRHNRILRSVGGGPAEAIAVNRKRLVGSGPARSCLTCGASGCHARPGRLVLA